MCGVLLMAIIENNGGEQMIYVPDLTVKNALEFSGKMKDYPLEEGEVFDFSKVHNCDPFPMLVVSSSIRQMRNKSDVRKCKATNCDNSYAEHMRFYTAMGIKHGKGFDENYGNQRYLPITKLDIKALREQGVANLERIQEVIVSKSNLMANVLSQGNASYKKWLSYALTEIMRNIPEHSNAKEIWYCAQYWPSFDLVELAILDEGIGIKDSLLSNMAYESLVRTDKDALEYALKPGISRTFVPGRNNNSTDEWANSGYGLYMVSRTCAALGGSFIVLSGNAALKVDEDGVKEYPENCHLQGTAIQIRVRLSQMAKYEEVVQKILSDGEKEAGEDKKTIKSASKSTKRILGY